MNKSSIKKQLNPKRDLELIFEDLDIPKMFKNVK
jgi:hypothetical protein